MSDEFYNEIFGDFIDEAGELLTSLNEGLLRLDEWVSDGEDDPAGGFDADLMNELFRSAHSLKGLSAMLGLTDINHLTHNMENVFDAARNRKLSFDRDNVELVFQSVDHLSKMVDELKQPTGETVNASEVIARIEALLQDCSAAKENFSRPVQSAESTVSGTASQDSASQTNSVNQTRPSMDQIKTTFATVEDDVDLDSKYASMFFDEAFELLDSINDLLLKSETSNESSDVETLLVAAHRFKGSAAATGFQRPAQLAHYIEDQLQELRTNGQPLPAETASNMMLCVDALKTYLEARKDGSTASDEFAELAILLEMSKVSQSVNSPAKRPPSSPDDSPADFADNASMGSEEFQHALAGIDSEESIVVGQVRLQAGLQLAGLKARLLYEKLSSVGDVLVSVPPLDDLEEQDDLEVFEFAVASGFTLSSIREQLDLAGVTQIDLDRRDLSNESTIDRQEPKASVTRTALPSEGKTSTAVAAPEPVVVAKTLPETPARPSASSASKATTPKTTGSKPVETLRVDIERLDHLMNLAGQLVINKARFSEIGQRLRHLLARKQTSHVIEDTATVLSKLRAEAELQAGKLDPDTVLSHIRRAEANLEHIRRDISQMVNSRSGIVDLFEAIHQLDRTSDGIQKSIMDTRMVPVGPLFNRFKRVVRDITRGNGKDIILDIHGEKTELDKRMIDELGDPLIHMVRNSADHGIESPETREAAGKPRQGKITLNAFHSGNSIVVQVKDDGKGLDPEMIRAKAVERGIVSAADAEKLTPYQTYQLIWEPGFSTAQQVTEISGRGMGMDIVRSKIEELNGHVDLDSEPGRGTTFTIKLPLTLAILPSLMAKIEDDVFALPIESVIEIVRIPKREISSVHGMPTATVRGRVISILELSDIFSWSQASDYQHVEDDAITLVIIGAEGRQLGLRVNELLGEEDIVIKSIAENYQNVLGIAGASILGDGRVALILDVATLLDMTANHKNLEVSLTP